VARKSNLIPDWTYCPGATLVLGGQTNEYLGVG